MNGTSRSDSGAGPAPCAYRWGVCAATRTAQHRAKARIRVSDCYDDQNQDQQRNDDYRRRDHDGRLAASERPLHLLRLRGKFGELLTVERRDRSLRAAKVEPEVTGHGLD